MSSPIRYKRLGYVALQVSDLDASTRFYSDQVGLTRDDNNDVRVNLRCSNKPYDIILEQGGEVGIKRVGLELESGENLDIAFDHLTKAGYAPSWSDEAFCEAQQVERSLRLRNPDTGLEVDFYTGQSRVESEYEPTVAHIARLGHVVLNVSSYADAHRFWVEDLGFVISDHVPGKIAFLRAFPNPLHHSLALIEGPTDGLNHVNFMVTDIDDIGKAINRMKKADAPIVFGPGRHLPSTSIFLYFLDPDGMTAEYSFGMEEFPEVGSRDPRELEPKPEVLDTWGSIPDPRFAKVGAIVHG